ncbi:MAG: glycerophosphodiester phosphodiesterase family protein [Pyrinomonadaceae bacterium]
MTLPDAKPNDITSPTKQPLIIGHRGSSWLAPENTMAAFRQALADGADGIEFDVRLARDGVPVVIHDANLRRVAFREDLVSLLNSTDLATCDVGSWFNQRFPALAQTSFATERVPTLDQLFSFFSSSEGLLYLEMKCSQGEGPLLAREVAKSIQNYSFHDRVVVLSFDLPALQAVKSIDPEIRTGALFQPRVFAPGSLILKGTMVRAAQRYGADEIALHKLLARPTIIRQASAAGLNTVVWTVDNPAWLETARHLGVHAIITNSPHAMLPRHRALAMS